MGGTEFSLRWILNMRKMNYLLLISYINLIQVIFLISSKYGRSYFRKVNPVFLSISD